MSDQELFEQMKASGVISDGKVYRFRLFSPAERRTILKSLPNSAAGMLDELEMVNFEVHGRDRVARYV